MIYALGLIGYPLEHSFSPVLHAAALQALGLVGEYSLYPTPPLPEGEKLLQGWLSGVREGELHGLNVTIPHKQNVQPYLEQCSETAQAIGAVNTITSHGGRLTGENTDAPGFYHDLQASLLGVDPPAGRALVLGAGGSARAVVYALRQAGWRVVVAARRLKQAEELVNQLQHTTPGKPMKSRLRAIALEKERLKDMLFGRRAKSSAGGAIDLIVNTTPAGMWPDVEGNPWPKGLALPGGAAIYDLVYNPTQTSLIQRAGAAGLQTANGLGMLVEQAALAFELWIGLEAPRAAMRLAIEQALNQGPEKSNEGIQAGE
jgi:shikimate dehydrogenase